MIIKRSGTSTAKLRFTLYYFIHFMTENDGWFVFLKTHIIIISRLRLSWTSEDASSVSVVCVCVSVWGVCVCMLCVSVWVWVGVCACGGCVRVCVWRVWCCAVWCEWVVCGVCVCVCVCVRVCVVCVCVVCVGVCVGVWCVCVCGCVCAVDSVCVCMEAGVHLLSDVWITALRSPSFTQTSCSRTDVNQTHRSALVTLTQKHN